MIPQRRPVATMVALAIALLALVGGAAVALRLGPPDGTAPTSGLVEHFEEAGIAFDYPATWRIFRHEMTTSFTNLIAQLSPIDIPAPCQTRTLDDTVSVECEDRVRLEPNTLVVRIDGFNRPTWTILDGVPGAQPETVGGLPAWLHRKPIGADVALEWTIANPTRIEAGYTIEARLRGPNLAQLEAQVRALVASLRYVPPVQALPPFGTGEAAVRDALGRTLERDAADDPSYRCFPLEFGTGRRATLTRQPSGPPLPGPAEVTCSTRLERSQLQMWRVVLQVEWPVELGRPTWISELYFTATGEYAGGRTIQE